MSRKRLKTIIVTVLLALTLSTIAPLPAGPSVVFASECDSTASCTCI
jgi:hypothetical protein